MALGKPILYAGKEVLIHLSCKDFNRNGLESAAGNWRAKGFTTSSHCQAITLRRLSRAWQAGLRYRFGRAADDARRNEPRTCSPESPRSGKRRRFGATDFFAGAVATNFKRYENEVVPQLLKLGKKIECGAQFIIAQIGFDARKSHEMLCYLRRKMQDTSR